MKKGALALFLILLTFASHGVWCQAARRGTMADAAHRHARPHLHAQGWHETQGRRLLGKLEHMAGAGGPGGGGSGGGRTTGGGAVNTRPHNTKNGGAVALPDPFTSVLALVFSTTILLSVLISF